MTEVIQIVSDDIMIRELTRAMLQEAGYRTLESEDGDGAVTLHDSEVPDLVLVHMRTNSLDGFDVCRRLRGRGNTPVVLLGCEPNETDLMEAFRSGADDVVTPELAPVMLAKIKALLRRCHLGAALHPVTVDGTAHEIVVGDITIDLHGRTVRVGNKKVDLSRVQFELLVMLARAPARVFTRQQLVNGVWGEWFGSDHHLDVHLSRLRNKIRDAGGPRIAHCIRGVGFKLHP